MSATRNGANSAHKKISRFNKYYKTKELYLLIAIPVILVIVFGYIPMFGNIIAFQDFSIRKGYLNSAFVGLKCFK